MWRQERREVKRYNDCLGEEPWEPIEKASENTSKEMRVLEKALLEFDHQDKNK